MPENRPIQQLARWGLLSVWLVGCAPAARAHGAQHRMLPDQSATVVEALYDTGNPMAFCDVSVTAPNRDTPFVTGVTDSHGRFAFVPDTNGIWKLTVDDGMGHRVSLECEVSGAGTHEIHDHRGLGHFGGGIVGVSVIFGLFGLYGLIKQARRNGRRHG